MSGPDLNDYIDVAERIIEFRTKHPEGSLQQRELQFIDFAGKSWVVFTARAYRSPDDPTPGEGTAWEPVPGATPFTRGSEVQNAETAAWGRAIVAALAADTKRGIASKQEVRARQEERKAERVREVTPNPRWDNAQPAKVTPEQLSKIGAAMSKAGITQRDAALLYVKDVIKREVSSRNDLTRAEASKVINALEADLAAPA